MYVIFISSQRSFVPRAVIVDSDTAIAKYFKLYLEYPFRNDVDIPKCASAHAHAEDVSNACKRLGVYRGGVCTTPSDIAAYLRFYRIAILEVSLGMNITKVLPFRICSAHSDTMYVLLHPLSLL